jgi:hypothetical protein
MDELAGLPEDVNFKLVVLVGDGMLCVAVLIIVPRRSNRADNAR